MQKKRLSSSINEEHEPIACVYAGPDILVPSTVIPSTFVIGRSKDCDIVLEHNTISRKHCEIKQSTEKREYLIRDLSSANGTYVNGKRIGMEWVGIIPGATIKLGNHSYSFEMRNFGDLSKEELWLPKGR